MQRILNKYTFFLLIVAAAGYFGWRKYNAPPEFDASLGTVTRRDIVQRVTISGVIVPMRTAVLSSSYDGYIQKIFVRMGQMVKTGEPVISITQTPDGRMEEVFPLRAPFSGKVVQILKSEGANVEKTGNEKGLVRIDDLTKLYIDSDTPEIDFPKLKIGQQAIIKASSLPEKTYKGEIISLFEAARSQERYDRSRVEFPIRVEMTEKDEQIKPGMSVTMDIITAESKGVLALRHDFVGKDKDEFYVVGQNGEKRTVTLGMRSEDAFEIVSGVNEGDKVQQVDFIASAKPLSANSGRKGRGRR